MKSTNPRYLVESILEGVDYVDERLDEALDEQIEQYDGDSQKEAWQRVLARWLIVRESIHGQVADLLKVIDAANREDLYHLSHRMQELATSLQVK
jgi:hypothetical protein